MSLKKLLSQNKKSLILYALGAVITSGSSMLFTLGFSNAFKIFTMDSTRELIQIGLLTLGLMLLPVILQIISRFLRIGFMTDILKEVRMMAYDRIMNMDSESFKEKSREDYQSQLISDINLFEKDFFLSILNISYSLFSSLIALAVLGYISWVIALGSLVTAIVLYLVTKLFEKPVREKRKQTQIQNKAFNQGVSNLVQGSKTLKHFNVEQRFLKHFEQDIETLESVKSDYYAMNKNQEAISEGIAMIYQVAMIGFATYLLAKGDIGVPALIVVLNTSGNVVWSIISGFSFVNRLKSSVDIYNGLVAIPEPNHTAQSHVEHTHYDIHNLSFSYDTKQIIDNLSLDIKSKDKILIHGPSGSGKTTFLNCLSQNLSGYEGSIRLGDHELHSLEHKSFLNASSYIRQSHFMFDDSILYNIILNQPYDKDKFERVLNQSALMDWVMTLDDKENHQLKQNGSNISGGQRQRISIARELYADADIIFVDEPSASLDDDNAEIIYDTILSLDKTVICVTHRHIDYLKDKFDKVIAFESIGEVVYEKA